MDTKQQVTLYQTYLFLSKLREDYELDLGNKRGDQVDILLRGLRAVLRPTCFFSRSIYFRCLECGTTLRMEEQSYADRNDQVTCGDCEIVYHVHWGVNEKESYIEIV